MSKEILNSLKTMADAIVHANYDLQVAEVGQEPALTEVSNIETLAVVIAQRISWKQAIARQVELNEKLQAALKELRTYLQTTIGAHPLAFVYREFKFCWQVDLAEGGDYFYLSFEKVGEGNE